MKPLNLELAEVHRKITKIGCKLTVYVDYV